VEPHGLLRPFTFAAEIARLPPDGPSGRRSETLVTTAGLRVVLVTMRAGTAMREHVAPGPITVQPIRGRFVFIVDGDEREISDGMLVALNAQTRHAVRALENGAFLLTIGWTGDDPSTGDVGVTAGRSATAEGVGPSHRLKAAPLVHYALAGGESEAETPGP
jgi:quercetin dioxygenase-like cupin family protein